MLFNTLAVLSAKGLPLPLHLRVCPLQFDVTPTAFQVQGVGKCNSTVYMSAADEASEAEGGRDNQANPGPSDMGLNLAPLPLSRWNPMEWTGLHGPGNDPAQRCGTLQGSGANKQTDKPAHMTVRCWFAVALVGAVALSPTPWNGSRVLECLLAFFARTIPPWLSGLGQRRSEWLTRSMASCSMETGNVCHFLCTGRSPSSLTGYPNSQKFTLVYRP